MKKKARNSNIEIRNKSGFTLIELLVTIVILGVLSSMGFVTFTGYQKGARDTQRKSDLSQYKIALENYATNKGSVYPSSSGDVNASTLCASGASLIPFMSGCLDDPVSGNYKFNSNGQKWVLWSELEKSGNYWVVCSDGRSAEKSKTGYSVTSGTCPL